MNLPAGVTAKADAAGATLTGICNATGGAAGGTTLAKFTAASGTTPSQVRLAVIKADGFTAGEFATANLDFTGAAPAASAFTVVSVSATDINGVTISGITVAPAVQIK